MAFHASNNALGYNAFSAQAADFSEVESGVLRSRVRGNASTFMIHEMVFDPTELRIPPHLLGGGAQRRRGGVLPDADDVL